LPTFALNFDWLAGVFALAIVSLSNGAELSPGKWPADERVRIESIEAQPFPFPVATRIVDGKSGLVSGTMSPIAIRVGIETLKQGGSAADAAAAVALTQVSTALGSYVSYAGMMQLTYYDAQTDKVYSMNAGWGSYLGETDPKTIPTADNLDAGQGRKTLVPGFMAGIESMHKRFGKLPFANLFEPAIWYSENGITVSPLLAFYFSSRQKFLTRTPEGNAFIRQAGGSLPVVGTRFVQPEVAKLLRAVAQQGSQYMYTGEWGEKFVAAVQHEGGKASMEDMKRYQPIWEEPLSTEFAGHTIFGPGPSSQGGYDVLEALNLLEALKIDQRSLYWTDPSVFQDLSRVLECVAIAPYIHSNIAGAAFQNGVHLSLQDRATKAYAKAAVTLIDQLFNTAKMPQPGGHSDGIVIIDRWGNVATLTHSINTMLWGTTGIVVEGVPLSDAACFQQYKLVTLAPGARVPSEITPIIVMTGGKPSLAVSSVGAALLPETVRILLGSLGNHLDLQTILAAPPLLPNFDYGKRDMVQVPERYDSDFLSNLGARGFTIQTKSREEVWGLKGTVAIGTIAAASGMREGVEVSGLFSFAEAVADSPQSGQDTAKRKAFGCLNSPR
jgi:gamma-glutamyltranspeptidase/glutathione hydrolase